MVNLRICKMVRLVIFSARLRLFDFFIWDRESRLWEGFAEKTRLLDPWNSTKILRDQPFAPSWKCLIKVIIVIIFVYFCINNHIFIFPAEVYILCFHTSLHWSLYIYFNLLFKAFSLFLCSTKKTTSFPGSLFPLVLGVGGRETLGTRLLKREISITLHVLRTYDFEHLSSIEWKR